LTAGASVGVAAQSGAVAMALQAVRPVEAHDLAQDLRQEKGGGARYLRWARIALDTAQRLSDRRLRPRAGVRSDWPVLLRARAQTVCCIVEQRSTPAPGNIRNQPMPLALRYCGGAQWC
jgi:hypothetical protein